MVSFWEHKKIREGGWTGGFQKWPNWWLWCMYDGFGLQFAIEHNFQVDDQWIIFGSCFRKRTHWILSSSSSHSSSVVLLIGQFIGPLNTPHRQVELETNGLIVAQFVRLIGSLLICGFGFVHRDQSFTSSRSTHLEELQFLYVLQLQDIFINIGISLR